MDKKEKKLVRLAHVRVAATKERMKYEYFIFNARETPQFYIPEGPAIEANTFVGYMSRLFKTEVGEMKFSSSPSHTYVSARGFCLPEEIADMKKRCIAKVEELAQKVLTEAQATFSATVRGIDE